MSPKPDPNPNPHELCIDAQKLGKSYGKSPALCGFDLSLERGRIMGLIGPNGCGKSTALRAMLGLIKVTGELSVLGQNPWERRVELMQKVSFAADVAVLPRWLRVGQAIHYMAGVHPRFSKPKAAHFLSQAGVKDSQRIGELSKGRVAQVHLALAMAVDAQLLVLDEPTLGLDVWGRKRFFDQLLADYFDESRSILIATHQLDEVAHVLSDVAIMAAGRVCLQSCVDAIDARFALVSVRPAQMALALTHQPIAQQARFDAVDMLFDGASPSFLAALGEVRRPNLSELLMGVVGLPESAKEST